MTLNGLRIKPGDLRVYLKTLKLTHDLDKGHQEKNTANRFATLYPATQVTGYGYTSVLHPFVRLSAVACG